ncbi:alcohol dehydrogenase catalytic domain-containing protein [Aeromicrobium sp.]|uniref:alcohol dehydrogenase catalytic domain-containing protein n=1 Tax=Aeromicrobium sp. TaxID=1871063 RepID=UPI0028AA05DB|nr:alcohol dehydrogenase catalytic domain-containing protein [Aeromicrobium sp.]
MTSLRTRALVHSTPDGLTVRELDVRAPRGDEVRVRVRASGVCHSDLHLIDGDWPSDEELVPGHEAAGVVESVGDDVLGLQPGDHVVLSWFPPCGDCVACGRGQQWLCTGNMCNEHRLPDGGTAYSADGRDVFPFIGVGALSEYVVVPEAAAVKVPDELPFEIGALIGCSVATGVGAVVNTAGVSAGQAAVVIGCGGVGQATIAGLALVGASPIIAIDLSAERLEAARGVGATHVVDGGASDVAAQVAAIAAEGVDFVFEAVGHVATISQAIALVAPGGAVVLEGLTAADRAVPLDAYAVAAEGKRILGCNYGSTVAARDFPRLASQYLSGELPLDTLVGPRISLPDAIGAFEDMRRARGGRAVVVFGE